MTVAEIESSGAHDGAGARRPNARLRQVRLRTPSPSDSGRPMSRQELAEAVNAHVYLTTGRVSAMNAHYVSRLERGIRRYPTVDYRDALRAVLGVASDAELGFVAGPYVLSCAFGALTTGETVATPAVQTLSEGMVTRLVVMPGMAAVIMSADHPVLLTLVDEQRGRG